MEGIHVPDSVCPLFFCGLNGFTVQTNRLVSHVDVHVRSSVTVTKCHVNNEMCQVIQLFKPIIISN